MQSDQQRRLLNLVLDLRPWLGTAPAVEQGPAAQMTAGESISPVGKKGAKTINEKAPPAPAPRIMVEQINNVLQAKLATSIFKDRGIQLIEGPGGVVMVKDGPNNYEGIDSVPDPEIKTLIRQAVSDWEKSAK